MSGPETRDSDTTTDVRSASAQSAFVTRHGLLEIFKEPGCPVCARPEQGSLEAIVDLLCEQVTNPVTRARLIESRGFCGWHAWGSTNA